MKVERLIAAMLLLVSTSSAWGADCAGLADAGARLACYDRLAECGDIADAQGRLACYDARVTDPPSTPSAVLGETPAEPPALTSPAPAYDPFPVYGRPPPRDDASASLTARVTEVTRDHRGRRFITLDNGQVWRELAEGRVPLEPGTAVEIRRGVLGSVNLSPEGTEAFIKVRRVE